MRAVPEPVASGNVFLTSQKALPAVGGAAARTLDIDSRELVADLVCSYDERCESVVSEDYSLKSAILRSPGRSATTLSVASLSSASASACAAAFRLDFERDAPAECEALLDKPESANGVCSEAIKASSPAICSEQAHPEGVCSCSRGLYSEASESMDHPPYPEQGCGSACSRTDHQRCVGTPSSWMPDVDEAENIWSAPDASPRTGDTSPVFCSSRVAGGAHHDEHMSVSACVPLYVTTSRACVPSYVTTSDELDIVDVFLQSIENATSEATRKEAPNDDTAPAPRRVLYFAEDRER